MERCLACEADRSETESHSKAIAHSAKGHIECTLKRPVFGIRNLAVPTVRPRKRGSAPRVSRLS